MDRTRSATKLKNLRTVFLLLFVLTPLAGFAEPYIAVREGLKCSSCHENHTGGGKRTRFGAGFGAQDLPWKSVDLKQQNVPFYWSLLNDIVSFGGDFRVVNQSTFLKDNPANSFETDKSNLYLSVRLLPDRVHFYLDESIAPGGAQTRELFGQLQNLPARGWLKAGKFVLPYGLRLEDDTAFIREVTGFNFTTPDLGAELGFEPGPWSFITSVSNGTSGATDNNTGKLVVGTASYTVQTFRIGLSGSYNPGTGGNKNSAALWGGIRAGKLVFLGEADFVHDETDPLATRDRIITYAEVDYPITHGWNLKGSYEYFDPDSHLPENERDRFSVGVEPFLLPFLQMQLFYRFNNSIPQNDLQNANELILRLHLYF